MNKELKEQAHKEFENAECMGYQCKHETSSKHYILDKDDIDSLIDKTVQMTEERVVVEIGQMKEQLADLEHDRWAKWQDYLHSKLIYSELPSDGKMIGWYLLDAGHHEHWSRQIDTDYKNLSEKEKNSDRIEAQKTIDKIISLITNNSDINN